VSIVSYGKDRPFCADHDEACHQQNRRGHMLLRK
jgi:peptidoglycan-associated lipoprotein